MLTLPAPLAPAAAQAILAMGVLSAVFAVKHLVADFLLQTGGMAQGKERLTGWLTPLLVHVACHAALTLLIVLVSAPHLWWLAIVDFAIHITVDRSKTLLARWLECRQDQTRFWWLLGFDQCCHQLTNIGLAAAILLW
jgi:hypothetical protein